VLEAETAALLDGCAAAATDGACVCVGVCAWSLVFLGIESVYGQWASEGRSILACVDRHMSVFESRREILGNHICARRVAPKPPTTL